MEKWGSTMHRSGVLSGTMSMPRTNVNNIFASSTRQRINADNVNNAQIRADDINGFVIV